jgi:hypothetical protein
VTAAAATHATQWLASAGRVEPARQPADQMAVLALFLARAGSRVPRDGPTVVAALPGRLAARTPTALLLRGMRQ